MTVELEDILRVLQQAEGPLKSAQLSKLLKQKSGKALKPVLDEEVRAGRIYSWGSDSYWDKYPQALARERLLSLAKNDGLDAAALKKQAAVGPPKIGLAIVGSVYNELAAENLLPTPRTIARSRLLNLAKGEFLAATALVKRAAEDSPKISQAVLKAARTELVNERLLRVVAKLNVNSQHPQQYLVQEIGRLLAEFGVTRSKEQIQALLDPGQAKAPVTLEADTVPEVAEKMFEAMNRIAFAPGTTVTFYRLRQQPELASVPKAIFDQAALRLQQERRALLAVHDHASRLPQEEQDQFVTDGLGTFYVSIYAV